MTDYKKLYQERKTRVETAVAGGQPDRVPNVLLVGTYPIHKAGMTMAESMVDHEKACQAMLSFYETHSCTDTASISTFMPANWTNAVMIAITMAMANEIMVSGIVIVRPGSRIFQNESIRISISRSLIMPSPFC